eukprot:1183260-Prorocentrum_minimum.AAC.6
MKVDNGARSQQNPRTRSRGGRKNRDKPLEEEEDDDDEPVVIKFYNPKTGQYEVEGETHVENTPVNRKPAAEQGAHKEGTLTPKASPGFQTPPLPEWTPSRPPGLPATPEIQAEISALPPDDWTPPEGGLKSRAARQQEERERLERSSTRPTPFYPARERKGKARA